MRKILPFGDFIIVETLSVQNVGNIVVANTGKFLRGKIVEIDPQLSQDTGLTPGDEIAYVGDTAHPLGLGFPSNISIVEYDFVIGMYDDDDDPPIEVKKG